MSPDESRTWLSRCCLGIYTCLKKNKEVVTIILVAFGACIAIVQVLIMREQSNISSQQTKIQEAQAEMERRDRMPYFIATLQTEASGQKALRISNKGFPIQYIQHDWLDVLKFSVEGWQTPPVQELVSYHTRLHNLDLGEGPLFEIVAESDAVVNLAKVQELFQSPLGQRISGAKGSVECNTLIYLGFRDIGSTELHKEYYSFAPGYGLTKVDEAAWNQENERRKSAKSLNQFTPDILKNIVDRLCEEEHKAGVQSSR